VIFLACLLLAAEHEAAQAVPMAFTTTASINSPSFDEGDLVTITILPAILSADELISISGGSVTGGESGSFAIVGEFSSGPNEVIATVSDTAQTVQLSTITNRMFPSGDLTGIVFQQNNLFGAINIPAGTVFTFDAPAVTAVAEPATLALLGTGLLGVRVVSRRRRKQGITEPASGTCVVFVGELGVFAAR
jgi:hypothetical protein